MEKNNSHVKGGAEPSEAELEAILSLSKQILKLSMQHNDMVLGGRAAAYSLALLTRIIVNFNSTQPLSPMVGDQELAMASNLLETAQVFAANKTQGMKISELINGLVAEVGQNRKLRRANNKKSKKR